MASEQPLAGTWTRICEGGFSRSQEFWSLGSGETNPPCPQCWEKSGGQE